MLGIKIGNRAMNTQRDRRVHERIVNVFTGTNLEFETLLVNRDKPYVIICFYRDNIEELLV